MKIIDQFQQNIRRIALAGAMATIIVTGLVGCGDATPTPTVEPTATTDVSSNLPVSAADTPVDTNTNSIAAPTQASLSANDPAISAQAPAADPNNPASSAQSSTGQADTGGSATGTEIKATLKEWAIDLSQKEVSAGKITFTVTNEGMMRHNLTVQDSNGGQIGQTTTFGSSEGAQTLVVDLKPGTYKLMCSLPGHAQRGQQTELVVK